MSNNNQPELFLHKPTQYIPPIWSERLKVKPVWRIPLAIKPTPIHEWNLEGIPQDVKLFIKRDDMTGSVLGGNKVRCLEFLLADAKQKGYSGVITCGSGQSNHCTATAIACNLLGLDCHLLLYDQHNDIKSTLPSGNSLLMQIAEPKMYLLPWESRSNETDNNTKFKVLADRIFQTTGKTSYIIPRGGASIIGTWGYIDAWKEMIEQNVLSSFDDIVVACGSGGTSVGLAIANYLTGSQLRIHTISISRTLENIREIIQHKMISLGITEVAVDDVIDICVDYVGDGYSTYKNEDIAFHKKVAATTGVYCDAVYTGKALYGFIKELNKNRGRFKGNRILFIHTGGLFSMMQEKLAPLYGISEDKLKSWSEIFPEDIVLKS